MFGIAQEQLLKNLERIRKRLCAYGGNRCDCKYMNDDTTIICTHSEHGSGCPELYEAIAIIESLNSDEFNSMRKRGKITIHELDEKDHNDFEAAVNRIKNRPRPKTDNSGVVIKTKRPTYKKAK